MADRPTFVLLSRDELLARLTREQVHPSDHHLLPDEICRLTTSTPGPRIGP